MFSEACFCGIAVLQVGFVCLRGFRGGISVFSEVLEEGFLCFQRF